MIRSQPDTENARDTTGAPIKQAQVKRVYEKAFIADRIDTPLPAFKIEDTSHGSSPNIIPIRWELTSVDNGMPANAISSLHIDSDGFLWLAYGNGLIRYDGVEFTFLDEVGEYHPDMFTRIHEDSSGDLWIPGKDSGDRDAGNFDIIVFRKQSGVAFKLDLPSIEGNSVSWKNILDIQENSKNQKVILRGDLIFYFFNSEKLVYPEDSNVITFDLIEHLFTREIRIPEEFEDVESFFIDEQDHIWFSSTQGLVHCNPETEEFEIWHPNKEPAFLSGDFAITMIRDPSGKFWMGGMDVLYSFNPDTRKFNRYPVPEVYYRNEQGTPRVLLHCFDAYGILWLFRFGMNHNVDLLWFDPVSGHFALIDEEKLNPGMTRGPNWTNFVSDRNGNVWASAPWRLYKFNHEQSAFQYYASNSSGEGLRGTQFTAIHEDPGDIFWIGTGDGLVNRWDRNTDSFQYYGLEPKQISGSNSNVIYSIHRDENEILWIGTENGLYKISKNGSIFHYRIDLLQSKGMEYGMITEVITDSMQNLWVACTRDGNLAQIQRYDPTCDCFEDPVVELEGYINQIHIGTDNILWIENNPGYSNFNGIWSYDVTSGELGYHYRMGMMGLSDSYIAPDENIWTVWSNSVLFRYDKKNFEFYGFDLYGLFPANPISHILVDHQEKFWLISQRGIIHFDPETEEALNLYDTDSWMPKGFTWDPRGKLGYETMKGDMMVGCSEGILVFSPDKIQNNPRPPQVSVVELKANGIELPISSEDRFRKHQFRDNIILPYYLNDLSITFTGLHFKDPKQNQFAYLLEGWDDQWIAAGTRRSAIYGNLRPATYTFRIKAANSDGVWMRDEEATALKITIRPPWWATQWAYIIYVLLAIGGFIGFIRWRTASLKKRQRELESTVKERTAELASQKQRSEELLLNILPKEVADELLATGQTKPVRFEEASILFADFKEFTNIVHSIPAKSLITELNEIFQHFDEIMIEEGLEKIKTVGDAYLAAGGVPREDPDHALKCVRSAKRMLEYLKQRNERTGVKWNVRIGIHSGPIIAGVVGKSKFAYDLFGDTVNIASRIETASEPGKINISAHTYDLVKQEFSCEYRGKIDAKGKGELDMYYVN